MKNIIVAILFSIFLLSCRAVAPTIRYSPPLNGEEDPQGMVAAGHPIQPVQINWYAILFYGTVVVLIIWLYFRNEGGEDMNHDGIEDSSQKK